MAKRGLTAEELLRILEDDSEGIDYDNDSGGNGSDSESDIELENIAPEDLTDVEDNVEIQMDSDTYFDENTGVSETAPSARSRAHNIVNEHAGLQNLEMHFVYL